MQLGKSVLLFADKSIWKTTGAKWAGRALVDALGSPDENLRTIAGMFLVQSGRKALPLLREALEQRRNVAMVLRILADIGATEYTNVIQEFLSDSDPEVAGAANDALRLLKLPPGGGAFQSSRKNTADRSEEILRSSKFGKD